MLSYAIESFHLDHAAALTYIMEKVSMAHETEILRPLSDLLFDRQTSETGPERCT